MGVKQFYEEIYSEKSRSAKPKTVVQRILSRFTLSRYDVVDSLVAGGDTFLDVTCGDGELLFQFKDRFNEVNGIDIAETRLERIRNIVGDDSNIHVHQANADDTFEFDDETFDPYHFIGECQRTLKTKGTQLLQVPNIAWLPHRIDLLFGKLPKTSDEAGWDGGHLHYFTVPTLKKGVIRKRIYGNSY